MPHVWWNGSIKQQRTEKCKYKYLKIVLAPIQFVGRLLVVTVVANNMQFLYNHNSLMTVDVFGSLHCKYTRLLLRTSLSAGQSRCCENAPVLLIAGMTEGGLLKFDSAVLQTIYKV